MPLRKEPLLWVQAVNPEGKSVFPPLGNRGGRGGLGEQQPGLSLQICFGVHELQLLSFQTQTSLSSVSLARAHTARRSQAGYYSAPAHQHLCCQQVPSRLCAW